MCRYADKIRAPKEHIAEVRDIIRVWIIACWYFLEAETIVEHSGHRCDVRSTAEFDGNLFHTGAEGEHLRQVRG